MSIPAQDFLIWDDLTVPGVVYYDIKIKQEKGKAMRENLNDLLKALQVARAAVLPYLGAGSAFKVDEAATNALRSELKNLSWGMRVAIGEGRNDDMPGLFKGECLGSALPAYDIALDPIDGTIPAAKMGYDQLWNDGQVVAAIALAPAGAIYYPLGPERRMERIAVPCRVEGLNLDASPAENLDRIAAALGYTWSDITTIVVSPHRNKKLIAELERIGIPIMTPKCDLGLAVAAFAGKFRQPHIIYGIGGGPETVVLAAAVRATGGTLLARLWCLDNDERREFAAVGTDISIAYREYEFIQKPCGVAVVGVTDGPIEPNGLVLQERS